ncbi:MAG: hypothetical protein ACTSQY_07760, partial [Candidatus Odinarchaeia archaeon]
MIKKPKGGRGKKGIILLAIILLVLPILFTNFTTAQTNQEKTIEVKPIGIVYSNLSTYIKQQQYDYYNSVTPVTLSYYITESYAYMAGMRFELIPEDNITDVSVIEKYSCIIMPQNDYIKSDNRTTLLNIYYQYLQNGGSIIGFGSIGYFNETNNATTYNTYSDYDIFLKTLFNVKYDGFVNSGNYTNFTINTLQHPITIDYENGTILEHYGYPDDTGVDIFEVNSTSIPTQKFIQVINSTTQSVITYWGFASEIGEGRSVYINAYDVGTTAWVDNTLILLRALQWCIFRGTPSVGLQLTPGRLIWMLTIDQDWCHITENTTSALRKLIDLADQYHFTFGWAIVAEGPAPDGVHFDGYINWTANRPLLLEAYSKGHDLASHSVTHVYWNVYPVNESRALYELNVSRIYLEGNLSVPITGLQVWGPGVWYGRYNASKYIPISGYNYVTELFINNMENSTYYGFPYMMGKEFYFGNISNINYGEDLFVLFRQSFSDYNFFDNPHMFGLLNYSEAWAIEKQNFDNLYNLGHGMPYNFLWHDYSIDNDSRIPFLYNMLNYEVWNKSDIYPSSPYELYHRVEAHDAIVYNITYNENQIIISLNSENVPSEFRDYTAGLTFRIENTTQTIQSVAINGGIYSAFSDNKIILPKLTGDNYEITINLGSSENTSPRITHITAGGLTNATLNEEKLSLSIYPIRGQVGRAFITMSEKPKVIFVNGTVNTDWTYNNNQLILNLTLSGLTDIDVFTANKIIASANSTKYSYFPDETIAITYSIKNEYPYEIPADITIKLLSEGVTLRETNNSYNLSPGTTISSTIAFNPNSNWPEGQINVEITVYADGVIVSSTPIQSITQVYGLQNNLLLASIAVIAAFTTILVVTNKYISSKNLNSTGRIITNGLFGLTPIIFNMGVVLFGGYIYSQILNPTDISSLITFYAITLPLTFTLFGIDLLSKRTMKNAILTEDIELTRSSINQSVKLSAYISIILVAGLMFFTIFTGIITFQIFIMISFFMVPNVFFLSISGAYQGVKKLLMLTGVYLIAAVSGVILSFYITYFNGLMGLIIIQSICIAIADLLLYGYLIKKTINIGELPSLDPNFNDKVFSESNREVKTLLVAGLLINYFLIANYLIYFLISADMT